MEDKTMKIPVSKYNEVNIKDVEKLIKSKSNSNMKPITECKKRVRSLLRQQGYSKTTVSETNSKRELPLFQFCKDKTQKDGHARNCKQCRSNYYYTKIKRAL